jgi:hypothetical protein
MSPTFTFTAVTGQVTETDELPELALAPEVDEDDDDEVVAPPPVELDVEDEDDEVPLVATGVTPKARSYTVAATSEPLAAVVCSTVVVLAVEVRYVTEDEPGEVPSPRTLTPTAPTPTATRPMAAMGLRFMRDALRSGARGADRVRGPMQVMATSPSSAANLSVG